MSGTSNWRNLMTLVVTMSVAGSYKGPARKTISVRQYVWDLSQQRTSSEYGKGQELLLLLGPVSEYGLTSPVGLEQARFLIMTDRKGNATAQNGRGNVGRFDAVARRAQGRGLHLSPQMMTGVQQHWTGRFRSATCKNESVGCGDTLMRG